MNRVCPLLGLAGDRRSAIDGFDASHRCHADEPPLPIERGWQARYCLTSAHPQCERYQQAMTRRGTSVVGRAAIGDGLASTRMLLAPEPPWRGMAGRARRAGPRRAAAVGASVLVAGAGALAVMAATGTGLELGTPESQATRSPTPTATPTREPRTPVPTPTPAATETPAATATPVPATPVPTVAPTAAPATRTYVVQEGDTLGSIAQQFGTTVEAIQAANGIEDPNTIQVGQQLVIP